MWARRIQKKAITLWVMRPLYADRLRHRAARAAERATRGTVRKALAGGIAVGLTIGLAWAGHRRAALVPAAVVIGAACWYVLPRLARRRRVARLARMGWSAAGLPSAWQVLARLGIDDALADRLVAASRDEDVRIASFDQNNRVRSDVGPIPFFADVTVAPDDFRPRARHAVDLTVVGGLVCIKKEYVDRVSFEREVLALAALTGVEGVPRLLAVEPRRRVAYQLFQAAANVGSMMAAHGAPVSVQYRAGLSLEQANGRRDNGAAADHETAVAALRASVGPTIIPAAARLVQHIHERGVTIQDVKYGNLLVADDVPYLCDFDGAEVHRSSGWRCTEARARDLEKFAHYFDADVMTERRYRAEVAELARAKPDLFYAPIYFGHGYEVRAAGSIELGSPKWLFIRGYLPPLERASIVDLGSNNGLLPHEMLRAGAARVTGYERDPVIARYARLNHRWFEFVDNRPYEGFELVEGPMHDACERDWTGYDIVTAFCSLYYEPPDEMARIIRTFSATTEWFVVQANESATEHTGVLRERASARFLSELLSANGYPHQRRIAFSYYDRPLIVARRGAPA